MARAKAKSNSVALVQLDQIRIDGGTQPRVEIDLQVVKDYQEAMEAGEQFPPVVIFHDGVNRWLADGFHRFHAAKRLGLERIEGKVVDGDLREAILYSAQANSDHGLRRSDEDKRRAVQALLDDEEWGQWSDAEIARRCRVSRPLVAKVREQLSCSVDKIAAPRKAKRGGKVYHQDTSKIGRKPDPEVRRLKNPDFEQLDPEEAAERERQAVALQTADGSPAPALAAHVPERGLLVRLPRSSADLAQVLADLYTREVLEDLVARLTKILGGS